MPNYIPHSAIPQHGVVLVAVSVKTIILMRQQYGMLKILSIYPLVVNGNLCGGAGVERVQKFGIIEEH